MTGEFKRITASQKESRVGNMEDGKMKAKRKKKSKSVEHHPVVGRQSIIRPGWRSNND